jgi:hypothetical protein
MSSGSKILMGGVAVLSLLASRSEAQTCMGSTGPDVIVGSIQDVANYAAVGNIEALSMGTTSCNIGTQNVQWQANNPLHPVIGGNLYRYTVVDGAGRFEQLGESWLKHGFTALTQNLCCTCNGQGGSVLGVGCADPYTGARNGNQSPLGPRYQVNAHTGVFVYPPAQGTGGSGSVYRRLQVDVADLGIAGARYFGETQYVTQDDATAGNQNNNTSYREILATGSGTAWTFALTGATVRMKGALEAWPLVEAGATVVNVQVPGDGLFVVGYKVTSIPGGLYRYEYAVNNRNADRNGGTFSIPVPNTVNVTNIGFHDVSYHDGDGNGNVTFSGLDWTANRTSNDLTWSTETQAQNNNANAIRWGTTYNFRFDADAMPVAGAATLGLWKTGSPASMSINVDVPGNGGPNPAFAYCFGDGSGTACPCGNNSLPGSGEGCVSSLGNGGTLTATGTSSISGDTIVLTGAGMTDSTCLYFQGTAQVGGGAGATFGDGLRCAGGTTIRLANKTNILGTSQFPSGGDPAVSVQGQVTLPGSRTYQVWYRNADPTFCTVATYNLTNGFQLLWSP